MTCDAGLARTWVLAFVVASAGGFAALIGIGCLIGANECPFGERAELTTTDGPTIFASTCAVCHGRQAEGTEHGPGLVSGVAADLSLDELTEKISRGRPFLGMPRFKGELSEEQIDAVARFVMELRGDP